MHTLPIAQQLLPEMTVAYDDDDRIPGLTTPAAGVARVAGAAGAADGLFWLVSCASVFLVDVHGGLTTILESPDETLIPLIAHVLRRTGKRLQADDTEARLNVRVDMPPHAHVTLVANDTEEWVSRKRPREDTSANGP